MQLPTDYSELFKNRILIITGVGRSGTTLLGKIIGSMKNVVYLFEPAIMKYFPTMIVDQEEGGMFNQAFLGTLFEDYILPQIQGRSINDNINDWSYYGNYYTEGELTEKWKLSKRQDAMKWIEDNNPMFVIKTNESQYSLCNLNDLFDDCRFLHIMRNGLDVVSSAVKRGWYTDDYKSIDWYQREGTTLFGSNNLSPIFIDVDDIEYWFKYTPATRAACAWRCLNKMVSRLSYLEIEKVKYEELCKEPEKHTTEFELIYDLVATNITFNHIKNIEILDRKQDILINDIMEPERSKFKTAMGDFGYAC